MDLRIKINYTSRKLLIMILLTVLTAIAVTFKVAQFNEASEFIKWIFFGYVGANVTEKFNKKKDES